MDVLELFLTGKYDVRDFIKLLDKDLLLRKRIDSLVPNSAINNPNHIFWKRISYTALENKRFSLIALITSVCKLNNTVSDNYNVFGLIRAVYEYSYPDFKFSDKYKDASNLYIDTAGERFDGPEVTSFLQNIIYGVLESVPKKNQKRETRERIDRAFHVTNGVKPRWIQGAEWPMGQNSPMRFVKQVRITDGMQFIFEDVDTLRIRTVAQFY